MAVLSQRVLTLAEDLVVAITGWQGGSENLELSVQFALSNFKFHQFLDVNDDAVARKLDGLCEKFKIHSRGMEAEMLRNLVHHFLSLRLLRSQPRSNAHYSLLSVLLCTSVSPLNVDYEPTEHVIRHYQEETAKEDVNWWYSYLRKDITIPSFSSESELEWSSDSESSEEEFGLAITQIALKECPPTLTDEPKWTEVCQTSDSEQLEHLVHRPYWLEHRCNTVSENVPQTLSGLTDCEIIKEILWLLQGSAYSSIFAKPSSEVHDIRNFVQKWEIEMSRGVGLSAPIIGACIAGLKAYLQQFSSFILGLEDIRKNLTVLGLYSKLRQQYRTVSYIHSLISAWSGSGSLVSLVPVAVLNDVWLLFQEAVCCDDHDLMPIVFPVAVVTMKAYLEQLEKCLRPENMWILRLHCAGDQGPLAGNQQLHRAVNPHFTQYHHHSLTKATCNNESSITESVIDAVFSSVLCHSRPSSNVDCEYDQTFPDILMSLSELLCIARKSLILMKNASVIQNYSPTTEQTPLYLDVFANLETFTLAETKTSISGALKTSSSVSPVTTTDLSRSFDPMLMSCFVNTLSDATTSGTASAVRDSITCHEATLECACNQCSSTIFQNRIVPMSVPFHYLMTMSLHKPVSTLCSQAASLLLHVLKKDYNLLQHISNIQNILLMGAGDVMSHLCSELFEAIKARKAWYAASFLNTIMTESLQIRMQELDDLFHVSTSQPPVEQRRNIELISVVQVDYQIPWPLDMVITAESMHAYNEIFRFLLQLKWARWAVQRCHLKGRQVPASQYSTAHSLHLLKRKLLHFVGSVDMYLLATVLHNCGLQFQRSVEQAVSFEDLVNKHQTYLALIYNQCLLNSEAKLMKEIILKVLNMCLLLGQLWTSNLQDIDMATIEEIHLDFSKYNFLLSTYLLNSVKLGSIPHLDYLADSFKFDQGSERKTAKE